MRPLLQSAREQLPLALARRAAVAAAELSTALGVSIPTLHRMLQERAGEVLAAGRARRVRYAWRRALRGRSTPWPLFEVQPSGGAEQVAELSLVQPGGSWLSLQGSTWPVPDESRDGWWGGLPYPLFDMRPQGYIGRQIALAEHRRLALPHDPQAWSDDDIVIALAEVGSDCSGSLILGEAAFQHWQQQRLEAGPAIAAASCAARYAELAAEAVAQGVPGSSAAGEFPKFPARREWPGAATPHVLVKFSGADGSPAVQRWSDLLVAEHLALEAARRLPGVSVAATRVLQHGGRTFLEIERFDRHGEFGRSPLVCLATVDAALLGNGSADWRALADRLHADGLLAERDRQAMHRLWWFGRLIANTDMHLGNLSFRPAALPRASCGLQLAPLYDMLPMLHAPLRGGELPLRRFEATLPLPPERPAWRDACAAALAFWRAAADDNRISTAFRALCDDTILTLEQAAAHA